MTGTARLVLLIPAYNAGETLGGVLSQVLTHSIPVLVVNDGSTDATREVAERFPVEKVLDHETNRGKGAALKTGFQLAREMDFTHVLTIDADGQHPVDSVPAFRDRFERNPEAILVGDRFSDNTIGAMPTVRRLSNGVSSRIISWAAGVPIPDAQCGMRVYPLGAISDIELESDGYAMETEVLVKAGKRAIEIVNIPISCHYPQGTATSRYRAFADSWRIAKVVWRSLRQGRNA